MPPVQIEILNALDDGRKLSMSDLVNEVRGRSEASASAVKAAVLPLILGDHIEMTDDRKLRLITK
jgi:hypothetical protein